MKIFRALRPNSPVIVILKFILLGKSLIFTDCGSESFAMLYITAGRAASGATSSEGER